LVRPSTGLVGVFGPPATQPVGVFDTAPTDPTGLVGVFDPLVSEPGRVMASSSSAMPFPEQVPQRGDAAPEPLQLALGVAIDTSSPNEEEIAAPVGGLSSVSGALVDGPFEAEPPLVDVQSVTEDGQVTEVQPRVGFEPVPLDKPEATPSATAEPEPNPWTAAEPAADVLSPSEALPPYEPPVDVPAGSNLVPAVVTLRKPRPAKVARAAKGERSAKEVTAVRAGAPAAELTAPHASAATAKVAAPGPKASAKVTASKVADPASKTVRPARPTAGTAQVPRSAGAVPARAAPVFGAALCPYCARVLQPPPAANRQCLRCQQLIVVKRVEGHVAYLTEAAVAIFEAERRKELDAGRWNQERERWLKLAAAAGARSPAAQTRIRAPAVMQGICVLRKRFRSNRKILPVK
jgi:hypothetical protein